MTVDTRLAEKEQDIKRLELYRDLGQTELLTKYYVETIEKFKEYHWYQTAEEIRLEFQIETMRVKDQNINSRIKAVKDNIVLNIRK